MRDESHSKQIKRWAEFCRDNPNEWKKRLKPFLDSQIIMAKRFYNKLSNTKEGKRIIVDLKEMKLK